MRPLNIPIEKIVVFVERYGVAEAAKRLNCDRGYIYKMLNKYDLDTEVTVKVVPMAKRERETA